MSDENPPEAGSKRSLAIAVTLFGYSVLSLYLELLVIRYLGVEITIFGYFKNFTLMAAFLGLSLGFMLAGSVRDFERWSATGFLFLCGIAAMALPLGLTFMTFVDPMQFMLFGVSGTADTPLSPAESLRTLAIMLALFALTAFVFVGLGQKMGRLFQQLTPLSAYSINIGGALAGTILFSLLCWWETSPAVWVVIAGILYLSLSRRPSHFAVLALGIALFWLIPALAARHYGDRYVNTYWTPYYRLDVVESIAPERLGKNLRTGWQLHINYGTFQDMIDTTPENLARFPEEIARYLNELRMIPFTVAGTVPESVLILGSGNGSDVQGALAAGVKQIDAVDIDPTIVRLGREFHPQKPYLAPNVRVFVMDARTFLKTSAAKYDAVVFPYLDSHAAFSSLSSLRTDNYIFTREAYEDAARRLKPNGYIFVSFWSFGDLLWNKHAKQLAAATGTLPLGSLDTEDVVVGRLVAGPAVVGKTAADFRLGPSVREVNLAADTPMATDDWPFLFLPAREVSATYAMPLLAALILSLIVIACSAPRQQASQVDNWKMFLLGAGFMLLEVRAMADLSLLFGSTWIVNSVVIGSVLAVALLGNWIASRVGAWMIAPAAAGLMVTLILSTLVQVADLGMLGPWSGQAAGVIVYVVPITFAAIIFALIFKQTTAPGISLAFNLTGGLCGIGLEYLSMWLGIRALGWIAVSIYALLLFLHAAGSRRAALANAGAAGT